LKIQQDGEKAKFHQEMQVVQEKGKWALAVASKEAEGLKYAADTQSESRIKVKEITVNSENDKQAAKAEASKEVNTSKENDKEKKPFATV
jgi:hypothetical protein